MPDDRSKPQTRDIMPNVLVTGVLAGVVASALGMAACTVYCLVDWLVP